MRTFSRKSLRRSAIAFLASCSLLFGNLSFKVSDFSLGDFLALPEIAASNTNFVWLLLMKFGAIELSNIFLAFGILTRCLCVSKKLNWEVEVEVDVGLGLSLGVLTVYVEFCWISIREVLKKDCIKFRETVKTFELT